MKKKNIGRNNRSAAAMTATSTKTTVAHSKPLTPFNDKLTLRTLLTMVAPTTGIARPTPKALRESGEPIAAYANKSFSLSAYENGFILARSFKRQTVVRLDECGDYSYDTLHGDLARQKKSATKPDIAADVFMDEPWPVRVSLTAEDRLQANNDNAAASAIGLHPSVAAEVPAYNRRMQGKSAEDIVIERMEKEEMMGRLTEKQREVMQLYYDEGYTQQEIEKMLGISQKAVGQHIMLAMKKVRKYTTE